MNIPWWGYVVGAGLAWGTYVPLIFFGGQMLSPLSPQGTPIGVGGRLASILCVGVAYFGLTAGNKGQLLLMRLRVSLGVEKSSHQ